jgi:FtsP/CotA-like multicopper oxidase with cupredoxin domain
MSRHDLHPGQGSPARWRGSAGRATGVLLIGLTLGSLVLLWPVAADTSDSLREITLVTRDMAFYLDGSDIPNPVLTMRAGETVRIVLRNEDVGMKHTFEIGAWDQAVPSTQGGRTASAVIEVPNRPGRHEYVCGPHPALMRGLVEVVESE